MALQFIFGNPGSGKSHYLYEHIIRESMKHPDINYIILVPEQFTMQTQRELVRLQEKNSIGRQNNSITLLRCTSRPVVAIVFSIIVVPISVIISTNSVLRRSSLLSGYRSGSLVSVIPLKTRFLSTAILPVSAIITRPLFTLVKTGQTILPHYILKIFFYRFLSTNCCCNT